MCLLEIFAQICAPSHSNWPTVMDDTDTLSMCEMHCAVNGNMVMGREHQINPPSRKTHKSPIAKLKFFYPNGQYLETLINIAP